MGIFDTIFGTNQPAPESAPTQQIQQPAPVPGQPTPPGNIPTPQVVVDPNNPTAPVVPVTPVVPEQIDESPLAEFSSLWDTKPTVEDPNAPAAAVPLTAEAVQKVVAKTDFSKVITPESMAAITAGGEGAAEAFAQAMNAVAQQVMVQSTMVGNKLTEQAVTKAREDFAASLPELLRKQASTDHLRSANPLFTNPAVKPVMEAVQSQLLHKFPNATNAEITSMSEKYIMAMGEQFAPKEVINDNSAAGTDWDKFMDVGQ